MTHPFKRHGKTTDHARYVLTVAAEGAYARMRRTKFKTNRANPISAIPIHSGAEGRSCSRPHANNTPATGTARLVRPATLAGNFCTTSAHSTQHTPDDSKPLYSS